MFHRSSSRSRLDSFRRTSDVDLESDFVTTVTKDRESRRRRSSSREIGESGEKWNTSVEEQLRLFAQIEREKRSDNKAVTSTAHLNSSGSFISAGGTVVVNDNVRQRSVSRPRKRDDSFSASSRTMIDRERDRNDDANFVIGQRQSRWESSRMTTSHHDRHSSSSRQKSSIVDRILGGGKDQPMDESDPALPDLLPFSVPTHPPVELPTRHSNSIRKRESSSTRKDSFVDRYLQKSKSFHNPLPIEVPSLPTDLPSPPEVPTRRSRRASAKLQQRQEPPTGNLIDFDTVPPPVKHERKLNRQQSLTRAHRDEIPSQDVYGSDHRGRRPSGTLQQLRRQDSMTNLNRIQNEISVLQDTTPTFSPTSSTSRSATYDAMATALLNEPPRRRFIEGLDNTENNRENLREMLKSLRKDAMDDDLEKCDGEYFPCEFCGDPYPVEYIMRHQVGSITKCIRFID